VGSLRVQTDDELPDETTAPAADPVDPTRRLGEGREKDVDDVRPPRWNVNILGHEVTPSLAEQLQ
jgi:hypothetical protein